MRCKHSVLIGVNCVGLVLLVLNAAGCTSSRLKGDGPLQEVEGVAYYLPVDLLQITVTTRWRVSKILERDTENLKISDEKEEEVEVDLASTTVADSSRRYRLELEAGAVSKDSLEIKTRPNGLLESINVTSEGRAGQVVQSIAKVLGTAAGAAIGVKAARPTVDRASIEACVVKKLTEARSRLIRRAGEELEQAVADVKDADLESSVRGLPDPYLFALYQSGSIAESWVLAAVVSGEVERLHLRLRQLAAEPVSGDPKDRDKKQAEMKELQARADELVSIRASYLGAVGTEATRLATQFNGATGENVTARTVRLNDLPNTADVKPLGSGPFEPDVKYVLDHTGILISSAGVSNKADANKPSRDRLASNMTDQPDKTETPTSSAGAPGKGKGRIYYRQPVQLALTVWMRNQDDKLDRLRDVHAEVVHPNSPIHHFEFESEKFADRGITVAFDERGRLASLKRTGTSTLDTLSAATADSATGLQDALQASLTKTAKIIETEDRLEIDSVAREIERLQQEKGLLDARVALEGAAATDQLRIDQATLAAQLARLQAEVALAKVEDAKESSLETVRIEARLAEVQALAALEKAERSALTAAKTDELAAEVARLRQEIELLKLRSQLEEP